MSAPRRLVALMRKDWDTVLLALLLLGLLAATQPLSRIAGWIPRTVLLLTLALLAVQIVAGRRGSSAATNDESAAERGAAAARAGAAGPSSMGRAISPARAMTWIAALLGAVLAGGAAVGTALFCTAYLRWHAGETWRVSLVFGIALGTAVQLLFGVLLQANLYAGWPG